MSALLDSVCVWSRQCSSGSTMCAQLSLFGWGVAVPVSDGVFDFRRVGYWREGCGRSICLVGFSACQASPLGCLTWASVFVFGLAPWEERRMPTRCLAGGSPLAQLGAPPLAGTARLDFHRDLCAPGVRSIVGLCAHCGGESLEDLVRGLFGETSGRCREKAVIHNPVGCWCLSSLGSSRH